MSVGQTRQLLAGLAVLVALAWSGHGTAQRAGAAPTAQSPAEGCATVPPRCRHWEVQQRPPSPPAGCYHRQQPLDKPTADFAVRPEAPLAP